jgi:erythromycin esterase-like protein
MQVLKVPPARPRSWEDVLHRASAANKLLLLDQVQQSPEFLTPRGHRAIGVVYHPEIEQHGNYVPTVLPRRYDALCYFDETHALHPLRSHPALEMVPETYPFGV